MLWAFKKKVVNRRAVEDYFGVNAGVALDQLGKFANSLRYESVGGNYAKPVNA